MNRLLLAISFKASSANSIFKSWLEKNEDRHKRFELKMDQQLNLICRQLEKLKKILDDYNLTYDRNQHGEPSSQKLDTASI